MRSCAPGRVGLQPKEVFEPTKAPKGVVISQRRRKSSELARGRNRDVRRRLDGEDIHHRHHDRDHADDHAVRTTTPTTTAPLHPSRRRATVPDVAGQKEAAP